MIDEKFIFSGKAKSRLYTTLGIGLLLVGLGIWFVSMGGGHHDSHAAEGAAAHGHDAFHWSKRLFANLWLNNIYFAGLSLIGVFFITIQYVAQAGWSVGVKRIPMAMASWLPIAGVLCLAMFLGFGHDIFHWAHHDIYDTSSANFDAIINAKAGYFFWPLHSGGFPLFYVLRMVAFFGLWYWLFVKIRRHMLAEDTEGGVERWKKSLGLSAMFLVFFGYSSSIAAWDWIMSIDTHWFSTMFGWYVFASWWVSGLAFITFVAALLKSKGYLAMVNANHFHDLGKFVWGFSIFWTYIWFSQFMLIYYANIPEETIYFFERMNSAIYRPLFFLNLIVNFLLPFLLLMTRDAKRHTRFLKVVCPIILIGHWLDFYLMITPGVLKENGGIGLMEIGCLMVFASVFLLVVLKSLSKHPLVAKNHPMMNETLNHHI